MSSSELVLKSLEATFGKVPKTVEDNIKYFVYYDTDEAFFCYPCEKYIKKVSEDKKLTIQNIESHLSSETHSANTFSVEEIEAALGETFLGKIPQIVLNNIFVLGMDEINYNCLLCEKTIPGSKYPDIMEENFSYHLLSWGHLDSLESYRFTLCQFQDVFGGIPEVILNNSKFIVKKDTNFLCKICEKELIVDFTDKIKMEENFQNHFLSSRHIRNMKQVNAFNLIPELDQVYTDLPNHILRNIEYISFNDDQFFCSLCNANIQFCPDDPNKTEQNFKLHNLSAHHEQSLLKRRDPNNEVFIKLYEIFEIFPETVSYSLKYLTMFEGHLFCNICEETIVHDGNASSLKESIIHHFDSDWHESNVCEELGRLSSLISVLENMFGSIPERIQKNIKHIKYSDESIHCSLCDQKFDLQESCNNAIKAKDVIETHLTSTMHKKEMEYLENLSEALETDLENLFNHVPQFIMKNWDHIGYADFSNNFYCFLCDESIAVVNGSKKKQLTLQNFRTHLFSTPHVNKLKMVAKTNQQTVEKLESIFGKVPDLVLCNTDHIHNNGKDFKCITCNTKILTGPLKTTESYFYQHLKSSMHSEKIKTVDRLKDNAFQYLDSTFEFWRIPEFILRNIDLICLVGNDLFCRLCQENLLVDELDLFYTKQSVRIHFDSDQHQHNLKSV